MNRLRVASQFPARLNDALQAVADIGEIVTIPPGPVISSPGADVLLAAPFARAGEALPQRPAGWPFGLQWVQLGSVGIDSYPDWLFDGPIVTSARGTSAVALAEYALAAIFSAAKRMPDIWVTSRDRWAPEPIDMVAGTTLGIVGFGAIGRALAPRAQALGMHVVATRRSEAALAPGVARAESMSDLFARSDHVVLAAPATPQTARMIGAEVLAAAKPGLHLINVARGILVDDEALLDALDHGKVTCATLDVTCPEPLPRDHSFYTHPSVRLSPHTSIYTSDTHRKLTASIAGNLARFRRGQPLDGVVDLARGY